ncbi:MAG: HAD hydrolase-like protein [Candidatus Omnitrophica bacterium]|nr:HAD hydrolase-like protein [Candidatus Omnitrophota bacterium]
MKTLILSHNINSDTPLYGGKGRVGLSHEKSLKRRDSSNVLRIAMNSHTSTHIDVPSHFIGRGKTLTDYEPGSWVFNNILVKNLEVGQNGVIDEKDFADLEYNKLADFLVIKTDMERFRKERSYITDSPVISSRLADFLKKRLPSLRAIGFNFISLSSLKDREEGRRAHRRFLKKGIIIVEDMRLEALKSRPDYILVSPLFIDKADGSPVSVWAFYSGFNFDKYDYFFFDFDGVILNSEPVKINGFVKLYERYGRKVVRKVLRHHEVDGGIDRYRKFRLYHEQFLGKRITTGEIKALARDYSRIVLNGVLNAAFIKGVPEFLSASKRRRKVCFIVSSTPEREINKIVKQRGLGKYFREVKGSPSRKEENVRDLVRKYGVDTRRSVLFGDSMNDVRAANHNGIEFVGIGYPGMAVNYRNFKEILPKEEL